MGTRSMTTVYDHHGSALCKMYRQFDGYPTGHGAELAEWLLSLHIVNGFTGEQEGVANGADCLAAQLVAHFKKGPGGCYLYPLNAEGESYNYDVHVAWVDSGRRSPQEAEEDPVRVTVTSYKAEPIFSGDRHAFASWCKDPGQDAD